MHGFRIILLYFSFCLLTFTLKGQTVNSNCQDEKLAKLYMDDADRMAIRRVNHEGSAYKDSVQIKKEVSKDYLNALIAIHNATALAATDTIIRFLNIHTYNPGLRSLVVIADSNLVWMTNLRYNILPTRDNYIDWMMDRYSLEKVFYSGLLQPSMVVFKARHNSNLVPIADRLKTAVGVKSAESETMYGDGNDIMDSITDKYMELKYSFGWQECSTGCRQRRYWIFRVYSDCSVEYMGSYGRPLQPNVLLSVKENEKLFPEINIYPDPVRYRIHVECKNPKLKTTSITLSNRNGQLLYTVTNLKAKQDIDMVLYPGGPYILTMQNGADKKVYNVMKE